MSTSFEVIARASTKDFYWSAPFKTFFGHVDIFGAKMAVFGAPDSIELKSDKTGDILAFAKQHVDQDYVRYGDTKGLGMLIDLNLIPGQGTRFYQNKVNQN